MEEEKWGGGFAGEKMTYYSKNIFKKGFAVKKYHFVFKVFKLAFYALINCDF